MSNDGSLLGFWETYDFPEEVRAEFLDGEIVIRTDPSMLHDVPGRTFVRQVPAPFEAWSERGVEIGPEDRPRPDVAILRAGDWTESMRDVPAALLLAVVEVVSTGRAAIRRDYQDKHLEYQESGIPVYVIVDPNIGRWRLFTLDPDRRYTETAHGAFGDPIPFPAPMGFEIPTTAFHRYPEG
jgi:Uma2 family endonuclease